MIIKNNGKYLETLLNITHEKYLQDNSCLVIKIPTNISLISVFGDKTIRGNFKDNLACDYIGVYKGNYFEFDAKETTKDYFEWGKLRSNQIKKLDLVAYHKGASFLIIHFSSLDEFYFVPYTKLKHQIMKYKKRVSHQWFKSNCGQLYLNHELKLDYLFYLNNLITL